MKYFARVCFSASAFKKTYQGYVHTKVHVSFSVHKGIKKMVQIPETIRKRISMDLNSLIMHYSLYWWVRDLWAFFYLWKWVSFSAKCSCTTIISPQLHARKVSRLFPSMKGRLFSSHWISRQVSLCRFDNAIQYKSKLVGRFFTGHLGRTINYRTILGSSP
jgi:hypothetical protein